MKPKLRFGAKVIDILFDKAYLWVFVGGDDGNSLYLWCFHHVEAVCF